MDSTPHPPPARRARSAPRGQHVLLVLGLLAAALPARPSTLDAARIRETLYPNGLRLIVKEAHATELASVQVWIRAGGFLEDERTSGTAHVIEHLMFKGAEIGASGSIDAEIENLGGLLEAQTEKDWTKFDCTLAGRYAGKALTVIAEALRKPQFRPEDWEAEKPVIIQEIDRIRVSPEATLSVALYDLAFEKHPYRYDVRGTPRFINQLDLAAVRGYYQKHYAPRNMVIVVVGDVDTAGIERVVRGAFAADQPGPKAAAELLPPDERACARPRRQVLPSGFNNGYVGLAFPAPSVKQEPDVYAMDLLLTLLENGDAGRLPRLLRGQGAVDVTYETRRQPGLLTVVATSGGPAPEQVETLIRRELEFLVTHPIPEDELMFAKRSLRGQYVLENEAYSGQAASLGYYAIIDRWQFASDYLTKVDAITTAQLQDTARKYLNQDHCVAVLLKPRGGAPGPAPGATGAVVVNDQ